MLPIFFEHTLAQFLQRYGFQAGCYPPSNSATPPPTIYLGIERASQLPSQFLQELDSVIIASAENSHLARNASALLPDAELANPPSSWNDMWIQLIEPEQQTHKQNNQKYKQRIQDIELD